MNRAHIFITGRVQGVFFRKFTGDHAVRLGLTGWTKNLPDRRMEVVAEGERKKLIELIGLIKKGPPLAKIEKVEVSWEKAIGEFEGFSIVYSE